MNFKINSESMWLIRQHDLYLDFPFDQFDESLDYLLRSFDEFNDCLQKASTVFESLMIGKTFENNIKELNLISQNFFNYSHYMICTKVSEIDGREFSLPEPNDIFYKLNPYTPEQKFTEIAKMSMVITMCTNSKDLYRALSMFDFRFIDEISSLIDSKLKQMID